MKSKITTIGPKLLADIHWSIDQVRRLVRGDLQPDERIPPRAPDDYIAWVPKGGIPGRQDIEIQSVWCDIYREKPTSPGTQGAPKEYERIVDGSTPFRLPIYNVYCEWVPGNQFVPTALTKGGTRYAINWYECESSSPSSSGESSSPSSSEESSSPSSSEESSSESSSPGCDYTGSIMLGVGDLHRVGDDVCESRVTLRFEGGKLCEITAAPERCVYICCDESSSPSSSEESSEESSSPSSSEESSEESSIVSSSGESSQESSSLQECVGTCTWVAVEDDSSPSDESSENSSVEPCDQYACETGDSCLWAAVEGPFGVEWSRRDNCSISGCVCYYPSRAPAFAGETILSNCGCGCGRCAYQRSAEFPYWQQRSGCADWIHCNCPSLPADPGDYEPGDMLIMNCVEAS